LMDVCGNVWLYKLEMRGSQHGLLKRNEVRNRSFRVRRKIINYFKE